MKKTKAWILGIILLGVFVTACGKKEVENWLVTCPWAETGVAGRVNARTAEETKTLSGQVVLDAQSIKGDANTVNQWVAENDKDSKGMIFVGEGLFAIAPIMNPDSLEFSYEDFVFIENLYSSIFVLSARADLNLTTIMDTQMYSADADVIKVAVNGRTNAESFLTYAFFGSMSHADAVELVVCSSADEAAAAVINGDADFAVSHQSQILKAYEEGKVSVICAFDGEDITEGPFAGVEGVGKYGYPYFRNRCFVMAPKGLTAGEVAQLKNLYQKVFEQEEIQTYYSDMMIEIDPMTEQDVQEHIENVSNIVSGYRTFFE
ncbi:MAG: hypothetical protein IKY94_06140 [Lachnospiraceae bacterium]|nr:hypothetical protein [Lachnospiraceae bacterium]